MKKEIKKLSAYQMKAIKGGGAAAPSCSTSSCGNGKSCCPGFYCVFRQCAD